MKVITWNVNSVRVRLERLVALLQRHQPDLLCLQEIKVEEGGFPFADLAALGYRAEIHGQRTYNGVALISRESVTEVARGFPGDPIPEQARAIAGTLGGLRVVNLYVVNGQALDSPKFDIKLRWLDALERWLAAEHDPAQPVLLVGDFNVAPEDRDIHDPEAWRGKVHASEPERERLRRLLGWGLSDLLREQTAEGGLFTWWDYRNGAFHRGWGLRIDLALGTAPVVARLRSVTIDREERKPSSGPGKPSDHAPVIVELEG
jgi:exodeoxyribonuclease-3